jgi:hypothetical protein
VTFFTSLAYVRCVVGVVLKGHFSWDFGEKMMKPRARGENGEVLEVMTFIFLDVMNIVFCSVF